MRPFTGCLLLLVAMAAAVPAAALAQACTSRTTQACSGGSRQGGYWTGIQVCNNGAWGTCTANSGGSFCQGDCLYLTGTKTNGAGTSFATPAFAGDVLQLGSSTTIESGINESSYSFYLGIVGGSYVVNSQVPSGSQVPNGSSVRYSVNSGSWTVGSAASVVVNPGDTPTINWRYDPVISVNVSGPSPMVGCTGYPITVEARDAYGFRAIGYRGTIHLTSSDAAATLPANHSYVAGDTGTYAFPGVILRTPGTQSITATDVATGSIVGTMSGIPVTTGPATSLILSGPSTVGTGTYFSISVDAREACHNRASTYSGPDDFSTSDGKGAVPGRSSLNAGLGTFTKAVVLWTPGPQTVTVTDANNGALTATITVNVGSASTFQLSGISSPRPACSTVSPAIVVFDQYGDIVEGYQGTVTFAVTPADGAATLPPNYKFNLTDKGQHTFLNALSLRTSGTALRTVTVSDTVTTSVAGGENNILVTPVAAGSIVVTGITSPITAGSSSGLDIIAYDTCRPGVNVATSGFLDPVSITSSDGSATLDTAPLSVSHTFLPGDNGHAHWTNLVFHTGGSQSVTVTDSSRSPAWTSTQSGIQVITPPSTPVITAPTFVTSGSAANPTSVLSQINATYVWTLTPNGGSATSIPGNSNAVTFNAGSVLGPLTLSCAVSNQAGSATGTRTITVVAAPSTPTITAPAQVIAGSTGNAASVPSQANASYAWTSTPSGAVSPPANTSSVTFSAGSTPGSLTLACTVSNQAGTGATGTLLVPISCASGTRVCNGACLANTACCAARPSDTLGAACDDGNLCTYGDQCNSAGSCVGTSISCANTSCSTQSCNGTNACAIMYLDGTHVCGSSSGVCDVASHCTGSSLSCPANAAAAANTICRPAAGLCDLAESCDGTSHSCPTDLFKAGSVVCRTTAGSCSLAATCTGSSADCPSNQPSASGSPCRLATGPCDLAGTCDGSSYNCPAEQFKASSVICGTSSGACDIAASCTGSSAACPANSVAPDWLACDDNNGCTSGEACHGGVCGQPTSTVTCSARDQCHVAGACNPSTGVCSNPNQTDGTACNDYSACTSGEACHGGACGQPVSTVTCSALDQSHVAGTCNPSTGVCTNPSQPPDPETVASVIDRTVATSMIDSTSFLYTGANPVQAGVVAGTLQANQIAVLRGNVSSSGFPLGGVVVTVLNHPEFGSTATRADGKFDIAVNGGGALNLVFARDGFLGAHRQVQVPWADYVQVPDLVLMPYDNQVTVIDLTNTQTVQVARGSVSTDGNGSRQATVLIPPGTQATMLLAGGGTQPLNTMHLRATEFTTGPNGPNAMPGTLPPTSGYTYAVGFTVDEAEQAAATSVQFSQPVYGYVENFLGFPVGTVVPSGYYDRTQAAWIPLDNGKIIGVVSITNGSANIDVNGDGVADGPAALAALGLSNSELQKLATLYQPGQSLWRVPLRHFSYEDWNWAPGLPSGAFPPRVPPPVKKGHDPRDCTRGSIIECENQTLGERLDVVGTPYSLNYRSDRVRGHLASYRMDVTIPKTVQVPLPPVYCPPWKNCIYGIVTVPSTVTISIAGRPFSQSNGSNPQDTVWQFAWDGMDGYNRRMLGSQPVTVTSCYLYPAVVYGDPESNGLSFSQVSATGAMITIASSGFDLMSRDGWSYDVCSTWTGRIGGWDVQPVGLGAWTLSAHHTYDPAGNTLYLGTGDRQVANDLNRPVANVIAGNYSYCGGGACDPYFGQPATANPLGAGNLAVAPDGTLYFTSGRLVGKLDSSGNLQRVAGDGSTSYNGDEIPATQATLQDAKSLAFGPEGSLYLVDDQQQRIRRIGPDGVIHTVAGNGTAAVTLDGAIAAQSAILVGGAGDPGLVVTQDGTVLFSESGSDRVRSIGTDGILRTYAGSTYTSNTNQLNFGGDNGPAAMALLNVPGQLALTKDGTLYINDMCNGVVRKVVPSGTISTVYGSPAPVCSDPNPGDNNRYHGLAVAGDGTIYIGTYSVTTRVRPDGTTSQFLGGGTVTGRCTSKDCLASSLALVNPFLTIGPDQSLFATDGTYGNGPGGVIFKVSPGLAAASVGDTLLVSQDASEVYDFDGKGRHKLTVDALTGVTTASFGYDTAGRLASITDRAGNLTAVTHDGQGNPTAIVSPYGQSTTLTVDSNGYLASVANPATETVLLQYVNDGLLSQLNDARNGIHLFHYDANAFLDKDTDPLGGFTQLNRNGNLDASNVTQTTAMGRTKSYSVIRPPTNESKVISATDEAGLTTVTSIQADFSSTSTFPDGTIVTSSTTADTRYGINAPVTSTKTVMPSGLTKTEVRSRSVTLTDPLLPLSVASLVESVSVNGQSFSSSYSRAANTLTSSSPLGRQTVTTVDSLGRISQVQAPGVLPTQLQYDGRGRPQTVTHGSRIYTFGYDSLGNLASLTDPLHTVTLGYDAANRPTSETLPDAQVVAMSYDANSNATSVTPPGKPNHSFAYNALDLEKTYTPPDVGVFTATGTEYSLDRQVSKVTRPAGDTIVPGYDSAGRLATLATSTGTSTYQYSPTTGALTKITAPDNGTLSYTYDGQLGTGVTWTGTVAGSVQRTYDNNLRVATESVNGGAGVTFGYDNDGLLNAAGALTLTRDPTTGFVTGSSLGGVTDARTVNAYGEPQSYAASFGSTQFYTVDYGTRDALGRIVTKTERVGTDAAHTFVYGYDSRGRLTDVSRDGTATAHYGYDANGNRTSATGLTGTPVYDAQDRMTSYGNATYTYKPDGSLLTKTDPTGTTTYDYDGFANLRHVALPNGTSIDYVIDGQNRRTGKRVNGALAEGFLYRSQLQPVAWLNPDNSIKARFVYGLHPNVPEYMVQGGTTYRLLSDQVGSVRLAVDVSTGGVVERIDYDDSGNILLDTAPGTQPFGFAGGLRDLNIGLTRFGARDYDPLSGRWVAEDPLLFGGGLTDLYSYVGSDSINTIDPSGRDPIGLALGSLGGGVAGGIGGFFLGGGSGAAVGTAIGPEGTLGAGALGGIAGGLGGAIVGSIAGGAIGDKIGDAVWSDLDKRFPFYPGWKPPPANPGETSCHTEQPTPDPLPPDPDKDVCVKALEKCLNSKTNRAICLAGYLACAALQAFAG